MNYNKHKNDLITLTKEILSEIPVQFLQYMDINDIKPKDHDNQDVKGQ